MNQILMQSFEASKRCIRMEEPSRLLTRFALDLVSQESPQLMNLNHQFDQFHMYNKTQSDAQSLITQSNENKSVSSHSKKRYKHWSEEDEQKLIYLIQQRQKDINELNDQDWSEMATQLQLVPQQLYWKVKRLIKEAEKSKDQIVQSQDLKVSRREMISNALHGLPQQKGKSIQNYYFKQVLDIYDQFTKKEIIQKIGDIYNINLKKESAIYKTIAQSLSKCFHKTPQEYALNQNINFTNFDCGPNPGMKQMIIAALLQISGKRGSIPQIKKKIQSINQIKIKIN